MNIILIETFKECLEYKAQIFLLFVINQNQNYPPLQLVGETMAQYFCYDPDSGSSAFCTGFRLKGYWSCISAFPSKIIRHIMEMIRTYIIKLQSQNLIHNNRLLAVPKISFEMIPIQDQCFYILRSGSFAEVLGIIRYYWIWRKFVNNKC